MDEQAIEREIRAKLSAGHYYPHQGQIGLLVCWLDTARQERDAALKDVADLHAETLEEGAQIEALPPNWRPYERR
jgi:hypothetical protein